MRAKLSTWPQSVLHIQQEDEGDHEDGYRLSMIPN
jgi:hypothetical protein